jgi:hypothetical protein
MRRYLLHSDRRLWITSLLLVSLVFRALIPVGFMPSSDKPFSLEICRGGFLAQVDPRDLDQNQHPGTSSHFEYCPFGSAPATGPISQVAIVLPFQLTVTEFVAAAKSPRLIARRERAHEARGPPRLV